MAKRRPPEQVLTPRQALKRFDRLTPAAKGKLAARYARITRWAEDEARVFEDVLAEARKRIKAGKRNAPKKEYVRFLNFVHGVLQSIASERAEVVIEKRRREVALTPKLIAVLTDDPIAQAVTPEGSSSEAPGRWFEVRGLRCYVGSLHGGQGIELCDSGRRDYRRQAHIEVREEKMKKPRSRRPSQVVIIVF